MPYAVQSSVFYLNFSVGGRRRPKDCQVCERDVKLKISRLPYFISSEKKLCNEESNFEISRLIWV